VEIAKALLHRPQVLIMDEASTGLDPGARRELSQYVHELRDTEGVTIVLTTHILDEAERCDRLVLLHQGKIVADGTPADLRSRIGGGHVVVLEPATDPTGLAAKIEAQFGVKPSIMDGAVRIEINNGHRFITEVVEAFPGAIDSVALHKPTLEDVFVHETGASIE
jgi:ABC-2 type transport system ATP-binding protein